MTENATFAGSEAVPLSESQLKHYRGCLHNQCPSFDGESRKWRNPKIFQMERDNQQSIDMEELIVADSLAHRLIQSPPQRQP